jgi:hypothetical protein
LTRTVRSSTTTTTETSYHAKYEALLPPSKTVLARQVVGWYEYTRALSLLDPLLNSVTPDELLAIEEIVKQRDELAIYVNLSRRLETTPSSLTETDKAGAVERRGLAWMMALARVELGALAAGFTDHPQPFALVPPSRYEAQAYLALLLDGARTHVLAMRNDPTVQYYASMKGRSVSLAEAVYGPRGPSFGAHRIIANEQQALAYARRVVVADEFVQASFKFGATQLSPIQQAELASYRAQLRGLQEILIYKVLGIGVGESSGTQTTSRSKSENASGWTICCPRLLEIAKRDIATGQYRLDTIENKGTRTTESRTKN